MLTKILIGFSILISTLSFLYCNYNKEKVLFVDAGKLFNEFKLTKELTSEMEAFQMVRRTKLDSLNNELKSLYLKYEMSKNDKELEKIILYRQENLKIKSQEAEEEFAKANEAAMKKIWNQLNDIVTEYGKNNEVDFILGANGQASLMYANEKMDCTKQVIEFANSRYNGKIK